MTNPEMTKQIIFNHEFAKVIWGDEVYVKLKIPHPLYDDSEPNTLQIVPIWQYHLMQMVIAPNAVEYLGEHLND